MWISVLNFKLTSFAIKRFDFFHMAEVFEEDLDNDAEFGEERVVWGDWGKGNDGVAVRALPSHSLQRPSRELPISTSTEH